MFSKQLTQTLSILVVTTSFEDNFGIGHVKLLGYVNAKPESVNLEAVLLVEHRLDRKSGGRLDQVQGVALFCKEWIVLQYLS